MNLQNFAWTLWIVGTLLIVMSWVSLVSPTTGWIGFGMSCVGALLSYLPQSRNAMAYPLSPEGAPVEPTGIWVSAGTVLEPGMRVLARSQERWWRARIIAIESDGRVRVNYIGWDETWEESHRPSQLQLDEDAPVPGEPAIDHEPQPKPSPTSIRRVSSDDR